MWSEFSGPKHVRGIWRFQSDQTKAIIYLLLQMIDHILIFGLHSVNIFNTCCIEEYSRDAKL